MTKSPNPVLSERIIKSDQSTLVLTITEGASNHKLKAVRDMPDRRDTMRIWTKSLPNGAMGLDIELLTQPRGVDGKPYSGYEQKFKVVIDANEADLMFGEDNE